MIHPLRLLAFGLVAGVAASVPAGPGAAIMVRSTLRGGVGRGFAALAGVLLIDVCYMGVFLMGLQRILFGVPVVKAVLQAVGGALLIAMGVRGLRAVIASGRESSKAAREDGAPPEQPRHESQWQAFRDTFAVSVTNPAILLLLTAIVAGAEVAFPGMTAHGELWLLFLGVLAGVTVWFTLLISLTARLRGRMNERSSRAIDGVAALLLLGFGIAASVQAVRGFLA